MIATRAQTVSVIIPVYNVESHLEVAVDSVVNQTYSHFELILVDDGSTDRSSVICDSLSKSNARIRVIHQKNSGVSVARNTGIEAASGKYITFVDADDTLMPDALDTMVGLLEKDKVDCVRTRCVTLQKNKLSILRERTELGVYNNDHIQQLRSAIATGDMMGYSWLLLIKRDILIKKCVRFPVGISIMEDAWFYLDLLKSIKSISISDAITYNYVIHDTSASHSTLINGFEDKVESIVKVNKFMAQNNFSAAEIAHINAVHSSNIASLLMVRGDRASMSSVRDMLNTVSNNPGVLAMYTKASTQYLGPYHRIATWAVIGDHQFAVRLLKYVRKVSGK